MTEIVFPVNIALNVFPFELVLTTSSAAHAISLVSHLSSSLEAGLTVVNANSNYEYKYSHQLSTLKYNTKMHEEK